MNEFINENKSSTATNLAAALRACQLRDDLYALLPEVRGRISHQQYEVLARCQAKATDLLVWILGQDISLLRATVGIEPQ